MSVQKLAQKAREASATLAASSLETRNRALEYIARDLQARREEVFAANRADLQRSEAEGLATPILKRLKFDESKLRVTLEGIAQLIALPDPLGVTQYAMQIDAGLNVYRESCPIGVIGIIFESRPDALVQIGTLCLKSGNGVLLKGGSEAAQTNQALMDIIVQAGAEAGLPDGWAALLHSREDVNAMLALDTWIDLIIPRGSNEFVRYIMQHSNIPVMGHADGICHVYVDAAADISMATDIVVDSKTQYVAVCNAVETLLVHKDIAKEFLPAAKRALEDRGVELRGCRRTRAIIDCAAADDADWDSEYLDLILAIKIVDDAAQAADHINTHGSGHTDCIVSADQEALAYFMNHVHSADVFANCSTRFADGFCFGLGAEVGIGTGRIHARGPVGMEGLLIYKYKAIGQGHTLAPYAAGEKHFSHLRLEEDCPL